LKNRVKREFCNAKLNFDQTKNFRKINHHVHMFYYIISSDRPLSRGIYSDIPSRGRGGGE